MAAYRQTEIHYLPILWDDLNDIGLRFRQAARPAVGICWNTQQRTGRNSKNIQAGAAAWHIEACSKGLTSAAVQGIGDNVSFHCPAI